VIESEDVEGFPPSSNGHESAGIVEEFGGWLTDLTHGEGSDLHVKVGTPPKIRRSGALVPLDHRPLLDEETAAIAAVIIPPDRRSRFESVGEVDFAYSFRGSAGSA